MYYNQLNQQFEDALKTPKVCFFKKCRHFLRVYTGDIKGDSAEGHNGILLPSMLIFTAWDVLLFFLMSVNFRICLSRRLTPFLELAWNLKKNFYLVLEQSSMTS